MPNFAHAIDLKVLAVNAADFVAGEAFPQRLHDGDAAGDGRLEGERDALLEKVNDVGRTASLAAIRQLMAQGRFREAADAAEHHLSIYRGDTEITALRGQAVRSELARESQGSGSWQGTRQKVLQALEVSDFSHALLLVEEAQGTSDKALATQYHYAIPWFPDGLTAARGANDAMGMGLALSTRYGPTSTNLNTHLGFQKPPPLWTLAHKARRYTDGSGNEEGIRTTMAFLLAFGLTDAQMEAKEPAFRDMHQYFLTLHAPPWPYGALDAARAQRGLCGRFAKDLPCRCRFG